jgi:hypothetical protein
LPKFNWLWLLTSFLSPPLLELFVILLESGTSFLQSLDFALGCVVLRGRGGFMNLKVLAAFIFLPFFVSRLLLCLLPLFFLSLVFLPPLTDFLYFLLKLIL